MSQPNSFNYKHNATLTTARGIAAKVRSGELNPVDVVKEALDKAQSLNDSIHAFREIWPDEALAAAEAVAKAPNLADLPLAGVPFAIKENTQRDDDFIIHLTDAGAIPIGWTVNPQFCTFGTTTSAGLMVDNPAMPGHTPGGSSGGSAAAVAAGIVPFAQGNDGMGSLRIPAACCGLSTLKSSPGVMPGSVGGNEWFHMSHHGVMTVDNADLAIIVKVLTDGRVDAARESAHLPEDFAVALDIKAPVFGIKPSEEYAAAARQAAAVFEHRGFSVDTSGVKYPLNPLPMLARWTAGVDDELKHEKPAHVEWRNRVHAGIGRLLRPIIKESQPIRDRVPVEKTLAGDMVLITPALAKRPPRNRHWDKMPWIYNLVSNMLFTPYASTWNYLGYTAGIVIEPVTGLPVQVIARPGQERLVITAMNTIASGGIVV